LPAGENGLGSVLKHTKRRIAYLCPGSRSESLIRRSHHGDRPVIEPPRNATSIRLIRSRKTAARA
jgi:hypothetical protein